MREIKEFEDVDRIGRYHNVVEGTDCFEVSLAISQLGNKMNEIIRELNKVTDVVEEQK